MREMVSRAARWLIPLLAIGIIGGGLLFDRPDTRTAAQRSDAVAASLRCPFCEGVSIAESTSQVARDLHVIIREEVDAGASDSEIRDQFVARYGEWVLLTPPISGTGVALWALPVVGLAIGVAVVVGMRRRNVEQTVEDRSTVSEATSS